MKQAYDSAYTPSAPVLPIQLIAPEWELQTDFLLAIVDTGADGTLVPIEHLKHINAAIAGQTGLRSQWGELRVANLYLVDIKINNFVLPGVWVVGDKVGKEIVLGRNVLNRLQLLLDGPSEIIEVTDY